MQSYKHKTELNHKSFLRCPSKPYKSKKVSKPSYFELFILLFGMFGVPLLYIIYSNVSNLYFWSIGSIINDPVQIINKEPEVKEKKEPFTLTLRGIISKRLKNIKKYSFTFSWTEIDRRNGLSAEEFHDMYSGKWPVIITGCGKKWPAFTKWNLEFFNDHYGKEIVTVKTYLDGVKKTYFMPLNVFISHINEGFPNKWTYIVDELFIQSRSVLERDIGTCNELTEDFFRLFPQDVRPWRYNLLLGPRYSRSELHIDPFNWTGTVMVLNGLKRWKLFPPGQDHLLHIIPDHKNKIPLTFSHYHSYVDSFNNDDLMRFPSVGQAKVIEFYQYPGELLIIPTGWFHQAINEEITLAVSGQIMNRDNYKIILEELYKGGDIPSNLNSDDLQNIECTKEIKDAISRISPESLTSARKLTLVKLAQTSGLSPPPSYSNVMKSQNQFN